MFSTVGLGSDLPLITIRLRSRSEPITVVSHQLLVVNVVGAKSLRIVLIFSANR